MSRDAHVQFLTEKYLKKSTITNPSLGKGTSVRNGSQSARYSDHGVGSLKSLKAGTPPNLTGKGQVKRSTSKNSKVGIQANQPN
jgi:hypothetical protein